jgi:cold shock CspA family protein
MIFGTFKFFNDRKRFGFISSADSTDYFAGGYEVEKARLPEPIECGQTRPRIATVQQTHAQALKPPFDNGSN